MIIAAVIVGTVHIATEEELELELELEATELELELEATELELEELLLTGVGEGIAAIAPASSITDQLSIALSVVLRRIS